MSSSLIFKKLVENAIIPKCGSEGANGYDISAVEDTIIPSHGRAVVFTGISIRVPDGMYCSIDPPSGRLARGIAILMGAIDKNNGEVKVILYNTANNDFVIRSGEHVAQLILEKNQTPEVDAVLELTDTVRGAGRFGSTGIRPL